MNELIWREFYTVILYHFPHVMEGPFREEYKNITWREDPADLEAWQKAKPVTLWSMPACGSF